MTASKRRSSSRTVKPRRALRNTSNPRDLALTGEYTYATVQRKRNGWLVEVGSDGIKGDRTQYHFADGSFGDGVEDELYAAAVALAWMWIDPDHDEATFKRRVHEFGKHTADVVDFDR